MTGKSIWAHALLIVAVLAVTFAAYAPGLSGPFVLDDYENLKPLNAFGGVTDTNSFRHFVFGNESGRTGRPLSMASFLVNDQYWPGSPRTYKYTNVLLHLLNGLLVFLVCRKIGRALTHSDSKAQLIGLVAMALWLVHPLNVSTTLYVIQRMTQLSALFTFLGLFAYLKGRENVVTGQHPYRTLLTGTGFVSMAGLAVLSKENGALIFLYAAGIELTIFAGQTRTGNLRLWTHALVTAPIALLTTYFVISWGQITNGYALRDFTLEQRLLTQPRIVMDYLGLILAPRTWGMGLMHDDISVSTGLLSPRSTTWCVIGILSLLATGWLVRRKAKFLSFAIAWFFAGHLLESTFIPLELYFEHRNYVPMLGPLFALAYATVELASRMSDIVGKVMVGLAPLFLAGMFTAQTAQATTIWGNPELLFGTWELEHPNSLRAKRLLARYFADTNRPDRALKLLKTARQQHPEDLAVAMEMLTITCQYHLPHEYDLKTIQSLTEESRIGYGLASNLEHVWNLAAEDQCNDISLKALSDTMYSIEGMPDFSDRGRIAAKILYMHSEVETARRNLNASVTLLDKAFKYQPTVPIALKKAVLLASAELYTESLNAIDDAKKADRHRSSFVPSRLPELQAFEDIVRRHQRAQHGK